MNWTGGRLQQSRSGRQTLTAQQKAYFAKAQTLSKTGNTSRPPPRFAAFEETLMRDGPTRGNGRDRGRDEQRKLEEFESVEPVVRRLEGIRERPRKRKRSGGFEVYSRGNHHLPKRMVDRVDEPRKQTKRTHHATTQRQQDFPASTEKVAIHRDDRNGFIEDLEAKRKRLLCRRDWMGTEPAKPVKMNFQSRKDRDQIGRRRQLKAQDIKDHARFQVQATYVNKELIDRNKSSCPPPRLYQDDISIRIGSHIHGSQRTATVSASGKAQGDSKAQGGGDTRRRQRSFAPPPTSKQQVDSIATIKHDGPEESSNGYLPVDVKLGTARDGCIIWSNSDKMLLEEHTLLNGSPMLLDNDDGIGRAVPQLIDETGMGEDSLICYGYRGARKLREDYTRHDKQSLQNAKHTSRDTHSHSGSPQTHLTDALDISGFRSTPQFASSEDCSKVPSDRPILDEVPEDSTLSDYQHRSSSKYKHSEHNYLALDPKISEHDHGGGETGKRRLPEVSTSNEFCEQRNHYHDQSETLDIKSRVKEFPKEITDSCDGKVNEEQHSIHEFRVGQLVQEEKKQEPKHRVQTELEESAGQAKMQGINIDTKDENETWFNSVFIPQLKAYIGTPKPVLRSDRSASLLSESQSSRNVSSIDVQSPLKNQLEAAADLSDTPDFRSLDNNVSQRANCSDQIALPALQAENHSTIATVASSDFSTCSADEKTEIKTETIAQKSDEFSSDVKTGLATCASSQPLIEPMHTIDDCSTEATVHSTKVLVSNSSTLYSEAEIALSNLKALLRRHPTPRKVDINFSRQLGNEETQPTTTKSEALYLEAEARLTDLKARLHRTPVIFKKPPRYSGSGEGNVIRETSDAEDEIEDD